jgi:hypothetical protein
MGILHIAGEERVHGTTSGVHPSQTIRNLAKKKEACKKINYVIEDPVITLTEDDVELVTYKVDDRGEEVVHIV